MKMIPWNKCRKSVSNRKAGSIFRLRKSVKICGWSCGRRSGSLFLPLLLLRFVKEILNLNFTSRS